MNLISEFSTQCHAQATHTALIENDRLLNYAQLQQAVGRVKACINIQYSKPQRIAIALDRGIDAAIAIIATLSAGCCYIPLDMKNPASRLQFIVNDADVQLLIGAGHCPEWLDDSQKWLDIRQTLEQTVCDPEPVDVDPETLAAILYTSGSTGTPKGVALSHRAILNFADWAGHTFQIDSGDHIASLAPFHFDLSTFDLFAGLRGGATLNFMPGALTLAPSRLTNWLADNRITTWYTVPSILSFIALKGSLGTMKLPALKKILFAGEVFPPVHLIRLTELLPDVDFYNLFGPTETNVCCYWPLDRNRLHKDQAIPIGWPACNCQLTIAEETAELLVAGDNNFTGYWQHGQLSTLETGNQGFKTGDKVSLNEYGEYCYHGRLNRMLKCSGYRVEPAEIENIIRNTPGVENCAVTGIEDESSGQRPVAAVILKPGYNLTDIINPVRQQLPTYMHPRQYKVLQKLPYLSNGKIDYQSLQLEMKMEMETGQ